MPSGVAAIFLSAFAFSVMTLFVKLAGERIPSQEIVLARSLVSVALSLLLLRRAGVSPWGHDRRGLWLRGLTGYFALSCVYAAVTHLPLADATVIHYLNPAFTALLAGFFLGEAISRASVIATGLCLIGVVLVAKPEALFGAGAGSLDPLWVAVAVAGALGSALAYVVVRKLGRTEHPLVIVFYFPLVNIPASLPFVVRDFVWPTGLEWVWLLGVGLATQVGQMGLTWGLLALPAGQAMSLSYLQVVFAAGFGVLVFGEWPDAISLAGGAIVIAGSLWAARQTGRARAPQLPTELEAIETGEVEIDDDAGGRILDGAVEAGERIGRLDQVVSLAAQQGARAIEKNPLVVDQENPGHLGSPAEAKYAFESGD